ncbi:TolC family protein [Flavisolibacter tropicus]|uniref:TolC family protein n=1 Tax=Flavisolibacter tropicus TaxID=1492898 RepID=UPI000831C0E9|nr:TolC family protein [Flavisolibacter tropicus]
MKHCLLQKKCFVIHSLVWLTNLIATDNLYAQSANNTGYTWNLQQCIAYAKQNNLQIASFRLTEQTSEQDRLLAKAAKYPNLIVAATQTLNNNNAGNYPAGTSNGSLASIYSLNSAFTLYNDNYLNNDIRQKDLQVKAAKQDILTTENDITLQIVQSYLQILLAKENVSYFNDLVKTAQSQTQQAVIKYNAGSLAKKEAVQLQAQLANDQYNLATATNNQRQATFNLKLLIQLPATTDFQIVVPDTLHTISTILPLTDVEAAALNHRPEIKSSELAKQAASFQLKKAEAGRMPVLSLNNSIASSYNNNMLKDYGQQIDKNLYERIGLMLSFPLFNNRIVKTNIAKSQIAIEQTDVDLRNRKTVLSQQVEQAYINSLNAQAQLTAAQKQLTANKESYRISLEELKLGSFTATDFLLQKNLYIQAMQAYLQAKYNALISAQVYHFYNGDPIEL